MSTDERGLVEFRRVLLEWYKTSGREFVWRRLPYRTPYRTVMAELMLRRTRADQVVPVYTEFITRFPTLQDAAAADPEVIRQLLRPLGLAWRTESVISFLREAYALYPDSLPADSGELQALTGVGDYVGAAVHVFAGGQTATLIDVNVVRVLGRVFGLSFSGEARRRKDMRLLADEAVDAENPADYHYAILDFAATICVARLPRCESCPFAKMQACSYYAEHMPAHSE